MCIFAVAKPLLHTEAGNIIFIEQQNHNDDYEENLVICHYDAHDIDGKRTV